MQYLWMFLKIYQILTKIWIYQAKYTCFVNPLVTISSKIPRLLLGTYSIYWKFFKISKFTILCLSEFFHMICIAPFCCQFASVVEYVWSLALGRFDRGCVRASAQGSGKSLRPPAPLSLGHHSSWVRATVRRGASTISWPPLLSASLGLVLDPVSVLGVRVWTHFGSMCCVFVDGCVAMLGWEPRGWALGIVGWDERVVVKK